MRTFEKLLFLSIILLVDFLLITSKHQISLLFVDIALVLRITHVVWQDLSKHGGELHCVKRRTS